MPINPRTTADQLTAFGIKPPKELADALAVLDAALGYTPAEPVDLSFQAMTVTAKDVPALLDKAIEASIRQQAAMVARGELVDRLERRAHRALAGVAEEVQTSVVPIFTTAAEAFTTAYRRLPSGWHDAESLVRSGPDAVAALVEAQQQIPVLDACRSIHRSLPTSHESPLYRGTAYAQASDTLVAEELAKVKSAGSLGLWGNLLAVEGCTALQFHETPDTHRAYVESLPKFEMRWQRHNDDGFGGTRATKVAVS